MMTRMVWTLICLLISLSAVNGQDRHLALKNRLAFRLEGEVSASGNDLIHTLTQLSTSLGVPMGLVVIKDADVRLPFSRTWKDPTVQQVIESVVASYPAYTVRFDESVVEIRPRKSLAEQGASILDFPIKDFTVRNEIVARVSQRLHQIFHDAYIPRKEIPAPGGVAGSLGVGAGGNARVTFSVESGTVRTVLNELTAEAGQIWMMAYPEVPHVLNGYLKTEYVNVDKGAKDVHQPVWSQIPFGIAIEVTGK